ncbi:hypothetical protein GCM10007874_00320 [Labrys miyagiensis]|uniref:Uncharacterized protein n=1 Tax=Labrys miyagiensis TaxID=346912 RepID=A0ABQ6CBK1_9HYPH|nr:hypothetical protein GCM10007874_00320 [Labrys miyagiensis]
MAMKHRGRGIVVFPTQVWCTTYCNSRFMRQIRGTVQEVILRGVLSELGSVLYALNAIHS